MGGQDGARERWLLHSRHGEGGRCEACVRHTATREARTFELWLGGVRQAAAQHEAGQRRDEVALLSLLGLWVPMLLCSRCLLQGWLGCWRRRGWQLLVWWWLLRLTLRHSAAIARGVFGGLRRRCFCRCAGRDGRRNECRGRQQVYQG